MFVHKKSLLSATSPPSPLLYGSHTYAVSSSSSCETANKSHVIRIDDFRTRVSAAVDDDDDGRWPVAKQPNAADWLP